MSYQPNHERARYMVAPLDLLAQTPQVPFSQLLSLYRQERFGTTPCEDDILDLLGDMLTDTLHHARCYRAEPGQVGYIPPAQLNRADFTVLLDAVNTYCDSTLGLDAIPDFAFRAANNYTAEQQENPA